VTHLLQPDTDILEYYCNENERDRAHMGPGKRGTDRSASPLAIAAGRILTRRSGSTPWKNGLFTTLRRPAQLRELRGSHAPTPFYFL